MRVDLPIPIDEPTSAVQNILRTTIASTSGTTFTLADNAGTSVTGGRVVHDNYQAFSAALALALTANYSADTIYLGPGIRPMILGDSEADPWSQWDDSRVAANVAFGFGSTNANRIIRFQQSTGSVLPIWGLSSRGQHADSGDQDFFFSTNFSRDFTWAGGNTIYVDAAEPKIIADDAWNRLYFYNDFSAGALQRIQGTKFLDANLYGFGRLVAIGTNKGLGSGLVIDGGDHTYGGAGHDAWVFGTFGRISNVNVCGHIGFGSTLIYTDDPGVEDRVIIDNLKVRRSRTDGIRLRSGNALLSNVHWVDCKDSLTLFENFVGGVENCTATNGGVMNLGGMFSASNLVFTNAQLNIVGGTGSVNGGSITFNTSADSYFSTSPHCCTVNNSGDVTINGLVITNQETSGPNRGIAVIGTGRTTLNAVHSWCASGYAIDIGSAMSGKAFLNGGYYRGAGGPQSNWMDFHVNGSVICRGVTFDAETASNTLYVDQGTLEFYNCHLLHALAGGPTTLVMKDCYLPAASASAVGVYTTGTCEGNRFGVAPTSTTPSLITFAGNKVNESSSVTVSSPIAASADNYALPVTDLAIVTLTGNQNFTGAAACANGTVKMILNDDGADTLTVKHLTTSSAANQIITPSGGDLAIGPRKRLKLERMDDIWYATAP
jgi:hypothetical protein